MIGLRTGAHALEAFVDLVQRGEPRTGHCEPAREATSTSGVDPAAAQLCAMPSKSLDFRCCRSAVCGACRFARPAMRASCSPRLLSELDLMRRSERLEFRPSDRSRRGNAPRHGALSYPLSTASCARNVSLSFGEPSPRVGERHYRPLRRCSLRACELPLDVGEQAARLRFERLRARRARDAHAGHLLLELRGAAPQAG